MGQDLSYPTAVSHTQMEPGQSTHQTWLANNRHQKQKAQNKQSQIEHAHSSEIILNILQGDKNV